jgi:hypothetical protein
MNRGETQREGGLFERIRVQAPPHTGWGTGVARSSRMRCRRRVRCAILAIVSCGIFAATTATSDPRIVAAAVNESGTGNGLVVGLRSVSPWEVVRAAIGVGRDSTLRSAYGRVYAVSRTDDNVTVIDANAWTVLQIVSTGAGSQPVDIAIVGPDTGYVTRRGSTHLLRLDLGDFSTTEVVDLSPLADSDGIPEMTGLIEHDGKLLVQLERFSNGEPFGFIPPATLAVVDVATETLVDVDPLAAGTQGLELDGTAAKHKMQVVPQTDTLYVSASGGFFDAGGLEAVDLTNLATNGLILEEAKGKIGADLGSFVLTSPLGGYLVFSTDLIESSHLVDFTTAGFVGSDEEIISIVDYRAPTILHDTASDTIFLPQGLFGANGVHVFAAADATPLTMSPAPLPGRPTDLTIVCDAAIECGDPACPETASCVGVPGLDAWAPGMFAGLLAIAVAFLLVTRSRASAH